MSPGARARSLRGEKRRWARARGGRFPRKPKAGAVGDQPCGSRLLLRTERGGEGGEEPGLKPLLWTPPSSAQQRAIDGGLTVTGHCCVEPGWKPNGESQTPDPEKPDQKENKQRLSEGGRVGRGGPAVAHLPQEEPPSQNPLSGLQGFQFRFPPGLSLRLCFDSQETALDRLPCARPRRQIKERCCKVLWGQLAQSYDGGFQDLLSEFSVFQKLPEHD